MRIHLINPVPRVVWRGGYNPPLALCFSGSDPSEYGDPLITDETLEQFDPSTIAAGDVVGIGIHTGNALRGYEVGRIARDRGAFVVYGGIHATLYPEEALDLGGGHAIVKGDGDIAWGQAIKGCLNGDVNKVYEGGKIDAEHFLRARWDLLPPDRYMWASVQTVRGCPKHCSFCSVWKTDGQEPRQRGVDAVIARSRSAAAPRVPIHRARRRQLLSRHARGSRTGVAPRRSAARLNELKALRAERFELMERLAKLPSDMNFFTQITMEAAEDPEFLDAMRKARIKGALVGVESVTAEGLKDVYKGFNLHGEALVQRLRQFKEHGIHVLGSFIFGLPSDRAETFNATAALALKADVTFAQFVMLTPFPGTVDFAKWELGEAKKKDAEAVDGIPITRHWLIPQARRPKVYTPHPTLSADEIRERTQGVWDQFYSLPHVWRRSRAVKSLKNRIGFVLCSKLYRQMYANTGIATDSARHAKSERMARLLAKPCRRLFIAKPMPDLQVPA